jgi:excisionase family DNA binding protein
VIAPPTIKRLYSREEAAAYLGISTWKLDDLIRNEILPYVTIGKRIFIAIEDLEDFVRRNKEGGV